MSAGRSGHTRYLPILADPTRSRTMGKKAMAYRWSMCVSGCRDALSLHDGVCFEFEPHSSRLATVVAPVSWLGAKLSDLTPADIRIKR